MSFNSLGQFIINSPGQPVVPNTTITSTAFNALTADLATGLSTAICRDGQSTTTTLIPFASGLSIAGVSVPTIASSILGTGPTLDARGYARMAGGLIVQWGYIISPGGTVTFPLAFPNSMIAACGNSCESGTAQFIVTCYPISLSQMGLVMSGGSGVYYASWVAIGT